MHNDDFVILSNSKGQMILVPAGSSYSLTAGNNKKLSGVFMFNMFKSGQSKALAVGDAVWPVSAIVNALKNRFSKVDKLAEDGPLKVYGVEDNGINFVVAVMQTAPGSGDVTELGFLARFVDIPNSTELVQGLNRNLHISIAAIEGNDLFLMAGLQVTGAFDEGHFNLIIEQWRRDIAVCIHGLLGDSSSLTDAFPAAKLEAARNFAANTIPSADGPKSEIDMLSAFLGAGKKTQTQCDDCGGRGRRGLIARLCEGCKGEGFVTHQR